MVEASGRASRKGELPNALFVVAAAESLPPELHGFADEVTIHFPWGSLLRGLLRADPTIVQGLVDVTRPDAVVTMLLSVTDRDRVDGTGALDGSVIQEVCRRLSGFGFRPLEAQPAGRLDLDAAQSSWFKRLAAGVGRTAWMVRLGAPGI
jgi:16S rRNA (adenine(1408)-N(1))-methyltransferase